MILVTGGAGYIGSHVVKALINAQEPCVVVDDLSTGLRASIPKNISFVKADIGNRQILNSFFTRYPISSVMHLAASISPEESMMNPVKYYENNAINSFYLWQLCGIHHIKHIVFSSTAAVYGQSGKKKISESEPVSPLSPYGKSKLMAEYSLMDICNKYRMQYTILRYFNVIGSDQDLPMFKERKSHHLLQVCLDVVFGKRRFVPIYGRDYDTPDETGVRDYVHVSDVALAHVQSFNNMKKKNTSGIYNVGYGKGVSVLSMIHAVEKAAGKKIIYKVEKRRPGDPSYVVADNRKIKSFLHWKPDHDNLITTIRQMIQ